MSIESDHGTTCGLESHLPSESRPSEASETASADPRRLQHSRRSDAARTHLGVAMPRQLADAYSENRRLAKRAARDMNFKALRPRSASCLGPRASRPESVPSSPPRLGRVRRKRHEAPPFVRGPLTRRRCPSARPAAASFSADSCGQLEIRVVLKSRRMSDVMRFTSTYKHTCVSFHFRKQALATKNC